MNIFEMFNFITDLGYLLWVGFILCISNVIAKSLGGGGCLSTIVVWCLILKMLEWISNKFKNNIKDTILDDSVVNNDATSMIFDVIENIELSNIFEIGEKVITFAM